MERKCLLLTVVAALFACRLNQTANYTAIDIEKNVTAGDMYRQ